MMRDPRTAAAERERQNVAIESAADSLLAVCALQTGTDPLRAVDRALAALMTVTSRTEQEQRS